ncbi:MAG: aspartate/glutamate racemase family protein [Hyphomonadaceae bacterium]
MKTVGIIAGLGPAAGADFFEKLVRATPATRDQDHLRVLIDSNPHIPDRNAAIEGRGPSPGPALAETARNLECAGAEVVVMACNAAHRWQSDIEAALTVPFLSMVDASAEAAARTGARRIGILAADACVKAQLYPNALARARLEAVELPPDRQADLMALIYAVKRGETRTDLLEPMLELAESLVADGAEALIAGCTEVPIVLEAGDVSVPFISSTDALIAKVLAFAR